MADKAKRRTQPAPEGARKSATGVGRHTELEKKHDSTMVEWKPEPDLAGDSAHGGSAESPGKHEI